MSKTTYYVAAWVNWMGEWKHSNRRHLTKAAAQKELAAIRKTRAIGKSTIFTTY